MTRLRVERALVLALGFSFGAMLSLPLVPEDALVWIAGGVAFALLFHAYFIKELGGRLFWPATCRRNHASSASFPLHGSPFRAWERLGRRQSGVRGGRAYFRLSHRHND